MGFAFFGLVSSNLYHHPHYPLFSRVGYSLVVAAVFGLFQAINLLRRMARRQRATGESAGSSPIK